MRNSTILIAKHFIRSRAGNIAIAAALVMPCLLGGMGVAADYSSMFKYQSNLQQAVDTAALAVAKEMALSSSDKDTLESVAKNYVLSNGHAGAQKIEVKTEVDRENYTIKVTASKYWEPMFLQYLNKKALPIIVSAKAALKGTGKICMIGLNTSKNKTIKLESKARMVGSGCGVFSNSVHSGSMEVGTESEIDASFICSSGGIKGYEKGQFTPTPVIDCPAVGDPLEGRVLPTIGSCTKKDVEIKKNTTLSPGVYCGGIKIVDGAEVILKPGIYVIKDGKLEIDDWSSISGVGVGLLLSGKDALIEFKPKSSIDLTAMDDGEMAGILIWGTTDKNKSKKTHKFSSDDARNLLGTIYLPHGELYIDSKGKIADESAYTAIIADKIELKFGPTLVLNSNYEDTTVPVPETLKGDEPYLIN